MTKESIPVEERKRLGYVVACVGAFAQRQKTSAKKAFCHLQQCGGIDFLLEHYEAEHTLSLDEVLDDLERVCQEAKS